MLPVRMTLIAIILAQASCSAGAAQPPPSGRWRLQGPAGVEVVFQPCGPALCGVLQTNPQIRANPDALDVKNPDPALRARRLVGISTFIDLVQNG